MGPVNVDATPNKVTEVSEKLFTPRDKMESPMPMMESPMPMMESPKTEKKDKRVFPIVEVNLWKETAEVPIGLTLTGEDARVQRLSPSSRALLTKRINVNQRLIEVNGHQVQGHQHGTDMIKAAQGSLSLKLVEDYPSLLA